MTRKEKEKTKSKKPWAGRLILGVAAAVGVVIVGASILRSAIGDSVDQEEEEEKNDPRKKTTMKAPGSGGQIISRDEFVKNPKEYFSTKRVNLKDAVDRF
ncbi:hypothetical protein BS78_02G069300 [Paspalum vaginatum]|nr:hypothetical protein BS78_02G069300 [Paspalum vaginatum]